MLITISTDQRKQVVDITEEINGILKGSGLVNLLLKHTTAALTIADLDPGTDKDYLKAIDQITPKINWSHPHNPAHFPDHLWSTIIGQSLSLPFVDGKLELGAWQSLVLIDLDGPRERQIQVTLLNN